jgi:hypothetical protein
VVAAVRLLAFLADLAEVAEEAVLVMAVLEPWGKETLAVAVVVTMLELAEAGVLAQLALTQEVIQETAARAWRQALQGLQ